MSKLFITGLLTTATFFLLGSSCGTAQKNQKAGGAIDEVINEKETSRIENILASDEMQGRKTGTPGIEKAADFISAEFKAIGLESWNNSGSYRQEFSIIRAKTMTVTASLDGTAVDPAKVMVISSQPEVKFDQSSGYELATVKAGANLQTEARKILRSNKNALVLVDESFANSFKNLGRIKATMFRSAHNVVFILGNTTPSSYSVNAQEDISEEKLANIVGILPGKSKKDEYVIFSGHYDHLGIGVVVNGDSIYNGANDDAAGITGMIMLAKYFAQQKNNERTIVFAAFTAEESGGYGSQYFSRQFNADQVMAMFNIEMIGTESKWGKNSAYITGYEKTDMGAILQKNLEGTGFTFHRDPYPAQQLFYRSDNATLARLGVPAHTISTSKMDVEPHYHKLSDHVSTLDLANMTEIIKAIALSSRSIVAGADTPSRVKND